MKLMVSIFVQSSVALRGIEIVGKIEETIYGELTLFIEVELRDKIYVENAGVDGHRTFRICTNGCVDEELGELNEFDINSFLSSSIEKNARKVNLGFGENLI